MKTKFYTFFLMLPAVFAGIIIHAQNTLKMGVSGGPAGNGPGTGSQAVTLYTNGTTAYTPAVTATYTMSNQQFAAGTLEGISSKPAMNFGGNINASANSSMVAQAYYPTMNGIGSPQDNMFSACSSCGATGISVSTDKAISLFNCTEAFINAGTGANTRALNARVYVGDITITFNKPVSNPVLHFVGLGGTTTVTKSGKTYELGFATEFDLLGSNVTLSKLAGNSYLNVTATQITNTATYMGPSSQGTTANGITRYAASGSVKATGTNITAVTLKVYVHGDGGRVSNSSGIVVSPDAGLNPLWALGATNAFSASGMVSGDLSLVGVSILKPVTISGNVFNDADGGNVNNSTGIANAVPAGMYANLVDNNGKLVSQVSVNTNGTFSFPSIFEGNYTVKLSVTTGTQGSTAPAASLPSGWVATGEFNGTQNTGNDGDKNSASAAFAVNTTDVANINFGIERPPLAPAQSYTIAQPAYNSAAVLNGTGTIADPGTIRGNDPEEGYLVSGKKFSITTDAAMNGNKLFYNGVEIAGTMIINNYNPDLLTVKYCGAGSVELIFTYQSYDAADQVSNPALYRIGWLYLLPVKSFEVAASLNGNAALISWKTSGEENTSRFYVERSNDNSNFTVVNSVAAAGNSAATKNYSVQDDISDVNGAVVYYRIRLTDLNGKITYSNIVVVRKSGVDAVKVFPNPFIETVNISFFSNVKTTALARITDMNGKVLAQVNCNVVKGSNQVNISNLKNIPAGIYMLQLKSSDGTISFVQQLLK
ncbi:MAG: T9SS type A sorting domain-containing protein [Ferruginibacter sp.]